VRAQRAVVVVVAALGLLGAARLVAARSAVVLSYPVTEVWSSAVRFIRVDRNYPIREKDQESGYILFDFLDGTKAYKASLELVHTTDDLGRDSTRAVFAIPDLPRHYEGMLLDKLTMKVREERGSPAPPPSRRPPAERPPDGGTMPKAPTLKDLPRGGNSP
jgi:hypothetical protein